MNNIDRLMFFILSVIMTVISLITAFLPLPFFPPGFKESINRFVFQSNEIALLSIVIFVLSLRLLFKTCNTEKNTYNYIERENELGKVKISFNTLRGLALLGIKKVKGVKEAFVNIDVIDGEVLVKVTVSFYGDVVIPEASNNLQKAVKENIESISGLNVKEIIVLIDETNNTTKRRVE